MRIKKHQEKENLHYKLQSLYMHSEYFTCLIFIITFLPQSFSDPRITENHLNCGKSPAPTTNYIPNFVKEMETLAELVTRNHHGYHTMNSNPPIYGLAQCFKHLSHTDCLLCYAAARTKLPRCLPSLSARIFFDGCFLRYDSYRFYNESVDPVLDTVNCSNSVVQETGELGFKGIVGKMFDNLTERAVANGGFAVMGFNGVFGLAQCWETLSGNGCRTCLVNASEKLKLCLPKKEGRAMNAGCFLRYSDHKFFNDKSDESKPNFGISTRGAKVAIALAAMAFFMLLLFAGFAAYMRLSKLREERNNLGQISNAFNKSGLSFKYETLEKATNYFDFSRKIGQGGAGSVFKGSLPNGKVVAVKRLIFNNRQWVDEFFNEVNLISGIQHKNLVKLLGCSIEGPESLLVYEYVHNKSLNRFLFDKNISQILNWKQRVEIIIGIAEGLAYLHGGSHTRIIHRDIKSSNILLDENLSPKIADFGLVRCFGADKSHLSTGIAGTLGYMAPEYLVRGQLTEKADVYSYGVLVLEIVCGKKNNAFIEDSGSLIQKVWKLYKANRTAESIDPSLNGDFVTEEVLNVVQIGLLCTQASSDLRPSMDQVYKMLTCKEFEIPMPNQPPFMNSETRSVARSYSINSLISKALTKIESSSVSTDTSTSILSSDVP